MLVIVVSNKLPFGKEDFKYFIGYKDAKKIRPLCIFRPTMNIYKINFYKTLCMYFLIKDEKKFKRYYEIWKNVSNIIKKEFNSKLVHNKKCLKFITNESSHYICTPVILIDSVYRKDKNYYSQVFLEKYNFNDDIEIYSDEEYSDDSDDADEKIQMNEENSNEKIKCLDLYQKEQANCLSVIPKC